MKRTSPILRRRPETGYPGEAPRQNTCKRVLLAEPDLPIHLPAGGLSSGPSGSVFSVLPAFRDLRSFGPDLAWIMLDPR